MPYIAGLITDRYWIRVIVCKNIALLTMLSAVPVDVMRAAQKTFLDSLAGAK